jgi:hypothetical protein
MQVLWWCLVKVRVRWDTEEFTRGIWVRGVMYKSKSMRILERDLRREVNSFYYSD